MATAQKRPRDEAQGRSLALLDLPAEMLACVFGWLELDDLLAARDGSRSARLILGPNAGGDVWAAVRPARLGPWLAARPLAFLRALHAAYALTPDVLDDAADPLRAACERGAVPEAQWMVGTLGWPRAPGPALANACGRGRAAIVEWLIGARPYTAEEVGASLALGAACAGGHLEIAQALTARFGQGALGVPPRVQRLEGPLGQLELHSACLHGRTQVVAWLLATYPALAATLIVGSTGFFGACGENHTDTVDWLLRHDEGFAAQIRRSRRRVQIEFLDACERGRTEMAQLLSGAADVSAVVGRALMVAEKWPATKQWLSSRYPGVRPVRGGGEVHDIFIRR